MSNETTYPNTDTLREALRSRLDEYCALTGASWAAVGKAALNDTTAVRRVMENESFATRTYERLQSWLTENWPADAPSEADEAA